MVNCIKGGKGGETEGNEYTRETINIMKRRERSCISNYSHLLISSTSRKPTVFRFLAERTKITDRERNPPIFPSCVTTPPDLDGIVPIVP